MVVSLITKAAAQFREFADVVPEMKIFQIDDSAAKMAQELSRTDWREWLPLAVPPYEACFIEWSPRAYIPGPDVIPQLGMAIYQKTARLIMQARKVEYGPFCWVWEAPGVDSNRPTAAYDPGMDSITAMAWAQGYVAQYGCPDYPVMGTHTDNLGFKKTAADKMRFLGLANECQGQARVGLAILALMNVDRERIFVPANAEPQGRAMFKNRTVPRYRPNLVVIRPDAPRRIYEQIEERRGMGPKRKEHDVRAHTRTLRDGRIIKVRSHERGDPALGRVTKRYIVEQNPG